MQFTDSHIHLQDYKTKNTQQIISDLQQIGFSKIICVSSQYSDFIKVSQLTNLYSELIIPAFGFHPWYLSNIPDNWQNILKNFLTTHPNAIIGECGLDRIKNKDISLQSEIFKTHLDFARQLNRPINIHLVHSEDIFSSFISQLPKKFMFHSYSGSTSFLKYIIKHDAFISINPTIFKRKNAMEIIQLIPLNRLLVESDAPYQNSYKDIPLLINKLSEIKNTTPTTLTDQIKNNFEEYTNDR